jgi:surface glycoprotein (TIGR04207 family)
MSDRRKQVRSAFLSVIMMLSVLAIGGTAFVGTAAAGTLSDTTTVNTTINSNPADFGVDADNGNGGLDHVITIEVGSNLAGEDLGANNDKITIDYSDKFTLDDNITASQLKSNTSAEVIDTSGSVQDSDILDDTNGAAATSGGSNNITYTIDDNIDSLEQGDLIRIAIDWGAAVDNPAEFRHPAQGESTSIAVDINEAGGSDLQFDSTSLELGTNAPIEIGEDDGFSGSANYSSLQQAISNLGGGANVVTVRENVSELESQPGQVDDGSGTVSDITVADSDFTIKSQ